MKKLIMILMMCLLMLGCRSRKKAVQISEIQRTETTSADTNVVVSEEKKLHNLAKKTEKIEQKEKSNKGDIVIKGQTDSLQGFTYHNIVNGDTLSDIRITGNADFIIKNRWKHIDKKEIKETVTEKLNIIATIARKSVAQKTIKEVAENIKAKEVSVKSSGFQFPVYLIIGLAVLLLIVLWFLWKKFGGGIMDRLNKKQK